jgi:hypothetical protein
LKITNQAEAGRKFCLPIVSGQQISLDSEGSGSNIVWKLVHMRESVFSGQRRDAAA